MPARFAARMVSCTLFAAALAAPLSAQAQFSAAPASGPPTKTTFIRLGNNANAILVEPATPDPVRGKIAVLVTHPERINNFNYFIIGGMAPRGYPVLAINYYGREQSYYELLGPVAAGIKALRAIPGVEKVVLAGHSTGAAELTGYQDVAENGPSACQEPERVYKCETKEATGLPKADALMILDGNAGSPERTIGINPAIDPHDARSYDASLDLFAAQNGYDPVSGGADYRPEFLRRFFAAQARRANQLIDEAQARLDKINAKQGEFTYDDAFVYAGRGLFSSAAKPEFAFVNLLSKTHGRHMLLKADGTRPVQIIPLVKVADNQRRPVTVSHEYDEPEIETLRSYLSTASLRLTSEYRWTEDNVYGVVWRSSASSVPGSMSGIRVPTLVMAATCAGHMPWLEIGYDRSPAPDKEFVGVEGANHGFLPCRPEYGDTFKRAFDYVDAWLMKPGRL